MSVSESAKILGLFPMPSKSHMAVNVAIVKEMAQRGHDVTVISPFPEKPEIPNYKNIVLDENVIEKHVATLGKELFSAVLVMTGEQAHTVIPDELTVPNHHNPYPTAFPYGNGMVLHFYQQQESSTTKTVHKIINKGLKTYV